MMKQILLQDQNFQFGISEGIGVENTPWKKFDVFAIPNSNADKYCIRIDFNTSFEIFKGEPVEYKVYSVVINYHGYKCDNEGETVTEYIETLKQSIEFCEKIQKWFKENKNMDLPFINK